MMSGKFINEHDCSQVIDYFHDGRSDIYRGNHKPPIILSIGNKLQMLYRNSPHGVSINQSSPRMGFVAYYKSIVSIPISNIMMAASLSGTQYYAQAIAYLSSLLLNISDDSNCLTFTYTLRSNLRVKITSHSRTGTLINWNVDGGRAFHRAAIDLPKGVYKIIWETTYMMEYLVSSNSTHNRYRAIVKGIKIHPVRCQIAGRFYRLLTIVVFNDVFLAVSKYHKIGQFAHLHLPA